jgi:serine/threonine-protein kinase PpkA
LHPNIVTIHDIGISEDGHLFLSIEYLSGGTLRDKIKQGLTFDSAIHIVRSIAKALEYAHERGIIHRDIKPSNIMFRHDGTPVLTDFGVARVVGSQTIHTTTGLMIGSPGYMSPEQAIGESATIQSDLYALGVIFYEMLSGHPPYKEDNPIAVTLKHLYDPIPDLPKEYADLQNVLNKLLAKKSSDRYKNAGEFLRALDEHRQSVNFFEDSIQQPSYAKNHSVSTVDFATGKIPVLLKNRLRFPIVIIGITIVIIFAVILYTFNLWNSVDQVAALEEAQRTGQIEQTRHEQEIATLLRLAEAQLKARLLAGESEGDNVEATYQHVLKLDPGNARALAGLESIAKEYEIQARQQLDAGALEESFKQITHGLAAVPEHQELLILRQEVERQIAEVNARKAREEEQGQYQLQAEQFLIQARSRFQEGTLEVSLAYVEQGLLVAPDHQDLLALREQVRARIAEQAVQRAEAVRRQQETEEYLKQALDHQRDAKYEDSLRQIEKGLALAPDHAELTHLREDVRVQWAAEQQRQAEQAKRDQEIETLLAKAEASWKAKRLTEPAGNNAEAAYRQVLQLDSNNAPARDGLGRIAQEYEQRAQQRRSAGALQDSLGQIDKGLAVMPDHEGLMRLRQEIEREIAEAQARQAREEKRRQAEIAERQQAEQAEQARQQAEAKRRQEEAEQHLARALSYQQEGGYADALQEIDKGLALAPDHAELTRLREEMRAQWAAEQQRQAEQVKREREIRALLEQAEAHLAAKRLTQPAGNNAEETYRQVLKRDPGNAQAQAGFGRIAEEYEQLARQRREAGALQESLTLIDRGLAVALKHEGLSRLRQEVGAEWEVEQKQLEQKRKEQEQQRLEQQRKEQQERQRLEQQRKEQQERQRLEQQRKEQQERQRLEQQRKEQEQQKKEQQRNEQQRKDQERQRLDQQRLEHQRKEQQRLEEQRLEQKRQQDQQRLEQQRLELQRQEQQRKERPLEKQPQPETTTTKPRVFGTF